MRYLLGMRGRLERSLWACGIALGLGVVGVSIWRIALSPIGVVLPRTADAPWIALRAPVTAQLHQWREKVVPVTSFVTTFEAGGGAASPETYSLDLRALGDFSVFVNGRAVAVVTQERGAPLRDWKRFESLDISPWVEPGGNSFRVNVRNPRGPGLLSLRLWLGSGDARSLVLSSGSGWRASVTAGDGSAESSAAAVASARAVLATDVAPHVTSSLGESPLASVRRHGLGIALLFALGAGAFLLWQRAAARSKGSARTELLPKLAGVLVAGAWLQLFLSKFSALDIAVGFDASSHLAYLDWLMEKGTLPGASDGWSMYHPPLFYLASAVAAALGEALGASRELALKCLPWLSGLALVVASRSVVRRLAPGDAPAEAAAIVFAGWLPMNIYLAAYYTNEGFHAAAAGLALASGVGLLVGRGGRGDRELTPRGIGFFSLWLGVALLSKFTALVVAIVLGAAVAIRIAARTRGVGPLAVRVFWLVAPALLIAGWFYARNLVLYGHPLVGNWASSEPGRIWWSEPGFHTADYYLRFGESLTRPFLSGFTSFWDALYSTAWGDGFLAGQGGIRARHALWNYEWMAAGYWLALPATGLLTLGLALTCRDVWLDPDPDRRGAFAAIVVLTGALGFASFWLTLELPYFGQAKAFYALAAVPAASLFFARGCRSLDAWLAARGGRLARAALFGWLAAFVGVIYLSFAA